VKRAGTTEADEQALVAQWLDYHGVTYTATANGAMLGGSTRGARFAQWRKLMRSGVKRGVPDLLIFQPPPAREGVVGVALEMKRGDKAKTSPEQKWWIGRLLDCGWIAEVAYGANDAISILKACGYGRGAA
jgi:hypothetical protein